MEQTYVTVSPHYPGGFVSPSELVHLAKIAEQYGGRLKITASSILLTGIKAEQKQNVLTELGLPDKSFTASCVRSIALCAGKPQCPRALQDSTAIGLTIDTAFYGLSTPAKVTMGVSGCPNCCAEVFVKDIGLFGLPNGYTLVLGGNAGRSARAGEPVAEGIPADQVVTIITGVLDYYHSHARTKERLGQCITRIGLKEMIASAIPEDFRLKNK